MVPFWTFITTNKVAILIWLLTYTVELLIGALFIDYLLVGILFLNIFHWLIYWYKAFCFWLFDNLFYFLFILFFLRFFLSFVDRTLHNYIWVHIVIFEIALWLPYSPLILFMGPFFFPKFINNLTLTF